jgi:hypothetical protein
MNTFALYSPPDDVTIDAGGKDVSFASESWPFEALKWHTATAGTSDVPVTTTDRFVPSVYETVIRPRSSPGIEDIRRLKTVASDFALRFDDSVASTAPDFVLRRTPPVPVSKPRGNTETVVAEWDGFVTHIDDATFEARLTGLRGVGVAGEAEEATIPKSEIRAADESLVSIGAMFRLCISYEKTPAGERRKYSTVVFRRLPAYRQTDLDGAHERTRARMNALRVE